MPAEWFCYGTEPPKLKLADRSGPLVRRLHQRAKRRAADRFRDLPDAWHIAPAPTGLQQLNP